MNSVLETSDLEVRNIVEQNEIKHIAVIMDGNRRWAKLHKLPTPMGHKKGVDALKNTVKACDDFGIKYLTVYAFSTENWNRKPEEVDFLMDLFGKTLKNELQELNEKNVVMSFIGDTTRLGAKLQDILNNAVEKTKNNTGVHLQIAFNYGSRAEITRAVKSIASDVKAGKISVDDISEDSITNALYTSNIPDPDYLVRTGGEMRISNYLLWQIAYSELIIVDEFWPEFDKNVLRDTIMTFNSRNRRFGV